MLLKKNVFGFIIYIVYINVEYFSECNGYHLVPPSYKNLTRFKRQSNCRKNQFRCNNGQCIAKYNYCDGKSDCTDESDEVLNCNTAGCASYTFRCAYGACVDGDAKCNGKQDCRDNSDESNCSENCGSKFGCKSGECIDNYQVCDSISNCRDGSDETYDLCKGIACRDYLFRCSYGACVDGDAKCNGIKDCVDNSDEDPKICREVTTTTQSPTTTPSSNTGCTAPVFENGKYEVLGQSSYVAGNPIPNYAIARFICNSQSYALTTTYDTVYCMNGSYQNKLPQCLLSCAPRFSTSIDVKCELGDVELDCSKRLPEGTIATMKCKPHYIEPTYQPSVIICSGGTWDLSSKICVPECGELVPVARPLITKGVNGTRGEFPWHVAIYREEPGKPITYICGGSIISVKAVLSAAHCFSKDSNGELYPVSEFSIAAGKYFSNWDAKEDADYVQKRKAHKIEIQKDIYLGYTSSYAGDIAVVVVDKPFILTNLVKPVCVDWNSEYVNEHLKSNALGQVVGWGVTSTGNTIASDYLKKLTIPFINRGQCLEIVPQRFKSFITLDNYCAGYTNGSSVCSGDSGGGMVFPQHELRSKKYYIQGVISLGPTKDAACDDQQIGVYTKLATHLDFIKKIEASNRVL